MDYLFYFGIILTIKILIYLNKNKLFDFVIQIKLTLFYYLTIEDNNAIFSADILKSIIKTRISFRIWRKRFYQVTVNHKWLRVEVHLRDSPVK